MSTFSGIEIGKRALMTQQKSLEVTGHNIANAGNEDYSRQRAIQSATSPYTLNSIYNSAGAGQVGTGVYVKSINRIRDQFVDARIRSNNVTLGEWTVLKENLQQIEGTFNELDETGLTTTLNEFWESFGDMTNLEEGVSSKNVRESVVQNTITLTTYLNSINDSLMTQRDQLKTETESMVKEINSLAKKIASLNDQIRSIESDPNKNANDLNDQRDTLLDELSELIDVDVSFDQFNQANLNVNGIELVSGKIAKEIEIYTDTKSITVNIDTDDDLVNDATYTYNFDRINFKVGENSLDVEGGKLKGLLNSRDKIIDIKVNSLDKLARELKNEVNYLHETGYDYYGNAGGDFFVFTTPGEYDAGNIAINQSIADDPYLIAASDDPDPLETENSEIAREIYRLRLKEDAVDGTTFEDFWTSQADKLGLEIDRATQMEENQQVLIDDLTSKKEEISGVSLDEEMTEMIKFQHGYNAAGKVISTLDEMLDTLINGIV